MYLCMYGNTYINVCMHGRYWETHSHVCLHACAQVSVHVCICVCMYSVCMYVFYDCRCVLVCVCHTRAGMSGDATKEWLRIHDVQELTAAAAASASISGLFSQGEGPSKGRSSQVRKGVSVAVSTVAILVLDRLAAAPNCLRRSAFIWEELVREKA